MNTIDLKQQVQQALSAEWPAFAQRHPHLAAILDETLLVEQATADITQDPAYRSAMDAAATAHTAASAADLIQELVIAWLKRLV